jgi:hypothetical protein
MHGDKARNHRLKTQNRKRRARIQELRLKLTAPAAAPKAS